MKTTLVNAGNVRGTTIIRLNTSFLALLLAVTLQLISSPATAADALDQTINIDIPAKTRLEDALIEWGIKAEMTVMMNTKSADRFLTGEVQGKLSARKALLLILKGSGLSYTEDGRRIRVVPIASLQRTALP